MSDVTIDSPLTAFGQLAVAEETPIIQIDAIYGLIDDVETFSATGGSGQALSTGLFSCTTGSSVGGYGVVRSRRDGRYRPGQGNVARFTSTFTAGVANSLQVAGPFTSENALQFGYNGTSFGILKRTGGQLEIQTLTLSAAAAGAENLTVTLDGTVTVVALTAGTTTHNAWQIANASFTGWNASSVGSTVIFVALAHGQKSGAFTASSTGSAAGTFAETRAGATPSDTWIPQASWNRWTGESLDWTKLNVFQIRWQWLGGGDMFFYVEDKSTGKFRLVHVIEQAGTLTTPSVRNPTFKIGWVAASLGSTTPLTVTGASAYIGVEGKLMQRRNPRGLSSTKSGVGATPAAILSLRNRETFGGTINFREIYPLRLAVGSDGAGSAPVTVYVHTSATLPGSGGAADEPAWTATDASTSCSDYDTAAETVSGGTLVAVAALARSGQQVIDLSDIGMYLGSKDTLTVSASTTSGTVTVTASLTWYED